MRERSSPAENPAAPVLLQLLPSKRITVARPPALLSLKAMWRVPSAASAKLAYCTAPELKPRLPSGIQAPSVYCSTVARPSALPSLKARYGTPAALTAKLLYSAAPPLTPSPPTATKKAGGGGGLAGGLQAQLEYGGSLFHSIL